MPEALEAVEENNRLKHEEQRVREMGGVQGIPPTVADPVIKEPQAKERGSPLEVDHDLQLQFARGQEHSPPAFWFRTLLEPK